MGKFGWRSGSLVAQNVQSGTVDITTSASAGSTAVTFKDRFNSTPAIVLTSQEADATGVLQAVSPTKSGFTATVNGSAITAGTLTVAWVAIEDGRRT